MANQVLVTGTFECTGDTPHVLTMDDQTIDQTTAKVYDDVWVCTTSDTVQTFGQIAGSEYGYVVFENLDATNYVQVGSTVAGAIAPFLRLYPGQRTGHMPLVPSMTLRTQANTGTCKVRATMYAK